MLNSFVGDFIGFQANFESRSHGAVHRIVGGCVDLSQWFRPLTELTQGLTGGMPFERGSRVCAWRQVVP